MAATQFEIDNALMAGRAYFDTRASTNRFPVPQGWAEFKHLALDSGFEAMSFQRESNPNEIVISYAGTDFTNIFGDWTSANIPLAFGELGRQLVDAALYYLEVKAANPTTTISFTGHSLGGGLAALMAVFFDEQAVTFDQAPFEASSAIIIRDELEFFLNGYGYSDAVLASLVPEFMTYGGKGTRTANVTGYYVQGDVLQYPPASAFNTIGTQTMLPQNNAGLGLLGPVDLHSQALLTAFLLNDAFRAITFELPDLLKTLLDKALYAYKTTPDNTTSTNFLDNLIRHQIGVAADPAAGVAAIPADAMLDRFVVDIQKLTPDTYGMASGTGMAEALVVAAMEYHYFKDAASATQLFTFDSYGLHFKYSDIGASSYKSQPKLVDAVNAFLTPEEKSLLNGRLVKQDAWHIQSGVGGMVVHAGAGNDAMIGGANSDGLWGGAGIDILIGGANNDVLVGESGNDYLLGGIGNDTYIFATGDGTDTVLDTDGSGSIILDGVTLTGGALVAGATNVWKNTAQGITYTLKGSGTSQVLLISKDGSTDSIRVQGWQPGQLGLTMAGAVAPPATATITGQDGYSDVLRGTGSPERLLGLSGNDLLAGAGGDDILEGGAGDDLIAGGAGSDLVYGGTGRDTILSAAAFGTISESGTWQAPTGAGPVWTQGRAWGVYDNLAGALVVSVGASGGLGSIYGNAGDGGDTSQDSAPDIVFAGDDDDLVVSGLGDDYLDGGTGDDQLWGHGGNDVIDGGDGNDRLYGDGILASGFYQSLAANQHGNDVLDGGAGNDQLVGGGGDDSLFGGIGNDKLWGDGQTEADLGGQYHGSDYLDGGDNDDQLIGGGKDDFLFGRDGDDLLWGDADDEADLDGQYHGNDYLDGGDGNDQLVGGGGIDILVGGNGNDVLVGDARPGTALAVQYEGDDILYGDAGDDQLVGGGGNDHLYGGADNDTLLGESGNDILDGGAGSDYLDGGTGADIMAGGAGDDTYIVDDIGDVVIETANEGNDTVYSSVSIALPDHVENLNLTGAGDVDAIGNAEANNITGNAGANRLEGGAGNDQLIGGAGADTLIGGAGDDYYEIDDAGDTITELADEGYDFVRSTVSYALEANIEGLALDGTADLAATGNVLDNSLYGNLGNNTLAGGVGNDFLSGGAGNDVYAFNRGDGQDSIDNTDLLSAVDTLRFGVSIAESDVLGFQVGTDMVLKIKGTGDQIAFINYYGADVVDGGVVSDHKIDRVEFTNGIVWDQAMIQTIVDRATNNHAPIVNAFLPALQAQTGSFFTYAVPDGAIADPDVWDSIIYSVTMPDGSPIPSWLMFDAATQTLSGTPDAINLGSLQFMLWGTDNYGYSVGQIVTLNVGAPNHAPVLSIAVPDQPAVQGSAFSYTVAATTFTDPDVGDVLSYTATLSDGSALPSWLSFDAATRTFSGTPDSMGTTSVRVIASDAGNLSVSDVFDIVVGAANRAPVVSTALPDQTAVQGNAFNYAIAPAAFTDPDVGDVLSYTATLADGSALPSWLSFDAATRTFSGTPSILGTTSVRVIASDAGNLSVSDVFDIVVGAANRAPVVSTALPDQTAVQGNAFNYAIAPAAFTDPDVGDVLSYTATLSDGSALPSWLSFDATTRTFSGTPDTSGTMSVLVTASDSDNLSASDVFDILVSVPNQAPVLTTALPDLSLPKGYFLQYVVASTVFADPEGGMLSYTATLADGNALPSWLSFDAITRTFSGTPDTSGTVTVLVTASDSDNLSASDVFDIVVGVNLTGTTIADILSGGSGSDRLAGNDGDDTLYGGAGNDHLFGDAGNDVLHGDDGNDGLYGGLGDDTLYGGAGDDTLNGATFLFNGSYAGNDTAYGGEGNDTYLNVATIIENPGEGIDTLVGLSGSTYTWVYGVGAILTLPDNVENWDLRNSFSTRANSYYSVAGNELDNILFSDGFGFGAAIQPNGTIKGDILDGRGGADTVIIRGYDKPIVYIDNPGDRIIGGAYEIRSSIDYILSTPLNYYQSDVPIPGSVTDRLVLIGSNPINGTGNAVANTLTGNEAANVLDGGLGADTLVGGLGNDTYIVDNVGDIVTETSTLATEIDTVLSSVTYTLGANVENLILTGTAAINGTGNVLANELTGNSAANILTGGAGNDTYIFGKGSGQDTVNSYDTTAGKFDTVQLDATVTPSEVLVSRIGNDLVLSINGTTDTLTILNYLENDGVTPYSVEQIRFYDGTTWDFEAVDALLTATASATIAVDSITADDVVNAAEASAILAVTGSVGGDAGQGDTVSFTLNGTDYSGSVDAAGNFSIDVAGMDLASDTSFEVTVEGTDDAGNPFSASTTSTHSVDTTAAATIAVDPITADDVIDAAEASAILAVTGSVGGDASQGDTVSFTLNGTDYSGVVDAAGNFSIDVAGMDLASDTSFEVTVEGTDDAGNPFSASTTSTHTVSPHIGNQTPELAVALPDQAAIEGDSFSYTVNPSAFTDPDVGDTLTYSATLADGAPLPLWLNFVAETRTFSGTPTQTGVLSIIVTATDAGNLAASDMFDITISAQNMILNGTTGADTLISGSGNDTLNGLAGNDVLNANAGNDRLDGGAGNDAMTGGPGDDIYIVDSVSDIVIENANEGIDTVESSVTHTLSANVENLTLTGNAAINGTGNSLDNVLIGNSAANILSGGAGADTLIGGLGNDTYVVDNALDVVVENIAAGTDTIQSSITYTLGDNVENLTLTGSTAISGTGNELNNVLTGNSAANTLTGEAGNDKLDGKAGADTLIGGLGNDTYVVDNVLDVIIENPGEGTDLVQSSVTYTLAANVENLTLTGSAAINGTGNDLNNVLTGNSAANTLTGGAGNDKLDGKAGADTLIGGLGNDTYVVDNVLDVIIENPGEGTDLVQSSVTYTLAANVENLTLTGSAAINGTGNDLNNVLTGNSAANTLTGGAGNDTLDGKAGADTMIGGAGDDIYIVDNTLDAVIEYFGEGIDTVVSSKTFTLSANVENLTLTGTSAINGTGNDLDNTLIGNGAANLLNGAAGNDTLDGGAGKDTLTGGTGNDTYLIGRGYGTDTVVENDATAGNTDVAQFMSGIAVDQIWFRKASNNLEVSIIGTSDKLVIKDWYLGDAYRVEEIKTTDGAMTLIDNNVQNLVNAMASFAPPAAGQTTLPQNYQDALGGVIAANWQ